MHEFDKFVPKGWGYEHWIVNCDEYCGKLLFFKKGKHCSYHFHRKKKETFYVHSGRLLVKYSDDLSDPDGLCQGDIHFVTKELGPGDILHIPPGRRHEMTGLEDTVMFEFSTHHDEEDSYRIIKGD